MQVINAIAKILKKEGVEWLIGYPVNPIIEGAAAEDIRTIMVRQERIGLHMCDAVAKTTSGDKVGVFVMQHGPGTENAFGGVAQSYGDSTPVVVLPAGYARNINQVQPNFNAALNFRHVTKSSRAGHGGRRDRRGAAPRLHPGHERPAGPGAGRVPDRHPAFEEIPDELVNYTAGAAAEERARPARSVSKIAEALVAAERPVIHAGQGVHYAKAWPQLKALAELLEAPVMTTLGGKSSFPENHPLSLGSGGIGIGEHLWHFLQQRRHDLRHRLQLHPHELRHGMPKGKKIDPRDARPDINKDVPVDLAAVGDAGLTLDAVLEEVKDRLKGKQRDRLGGVTREIRGIARSGSASGSTG
jgi:thiamine pyrophosphate-dependent acetolactate synthase large subunit-like protein